MEDRSVDMLADTSQQQITSRNSKSKDHLEALKRILDLCNAGELT